MILAISSNFYGCEMKKSIIITIDIKGFNKQTQLESSADTANYLTEYYEYIADLISPFKWRYVKSIGDCVLLSAENNNSADDIENLFKKVAYILSRETF